MKAKRTNGGAKPSSKKSVKAKLRINPQALQSGPGGSGPWKIKIEILDKYDNSLAAMIIRPKPPTPPIVPTEFVKFLGVGVRMLLIRGT